ncbi:MAG: glycosyltransferase family 4 protein [Candidatus Kapabacteria bacterium]|nr:glycosyltransferase family 4 protein [Candidatus Kapabacteria bacterium]MDW7997338.1 glycosyltransferase family 4 protein [Bacteroidota bacterium]MDW8225580.1 glycosyltransferase family 4 protein [Bacteroidota bacterium]
MRVAILTNIESPYRTPLFNAVADRLGGELLVVCAGEREPLRFWQHQAVQRRFYVRVLPGLHFSWLRWEWSLHLNWGLGKTLRSFDPEVLVIGGYDQPLYWQGLWYARRRRIPTVLWYESWQESARARRGPVFALKNFFVRYTTLGLAFGTLAAAWLRQIHGGSYPIVITLNTVDMDFFRKQAWVFRQSPEFALWRATYPSLLLLYVGSFARRKNPVVVLEALRLLQNPEIGLLLIGAGPQETELRVLTREYGLENAVFFEGYRQQWELPRFYALADVLLLPSLREVWGLVVNEALAAGLYVLCSTKVAAGHDMIQPGWNGDLFEPTDVEQLAHLLQRVRNNLAALRERRGAISEHACREFSIERAAERFVEGIQLARQSQ